MSEYIAWQSQFPNIRKLTLDFRFYEGSSPWAIACAQCGLASARLEKLKDWLSTMQLGLRADSVKVLTMNYYRPMSHSIRPCTCALEIEELFAKMTTRE